MDGVHDLIRAIKRIKPPKGREYCREKHCEWRKDGDRVCCLPRCMKRKEKEE